MANGTIKRFTAEERLRTFGELKIDSGDFQKKLSNYIKANVEQYNHGTFVVGWYTASPTNLPSDFPTAGAYIALFPRGLSLGIRIVELTTMKYGIVEYSPD